MRKIITTTMITLDGVMQAPSGSKEDSAEGFKYGGWQVGWNEEADTIMDTRVQTAPFDLLLGRRTYDIFAAYWPKHTDEPHWGKPFDKAKKYVASHKPLKLSWSNSVLITGDVVAEIKKLKHPPAHSTSVNVAGSDGPDLLIYGSGNLIQLLLKHNLIDRMHLWIFPVTIGSGKKLFAEGTRPKLLKMVDAKITSTGLIYACYEPSTPLKAESV